MRVHRSAILIDTHNDIPSDTVAGLDIGKPNTDHMTDLPRMKKGGMGAQFFAAYVAALRRGQPCRQPRVADDRHGAARHHREISQRFSFRHHRRRHTPRAQAA
jgi:microsomal dipeptidase-like Zn-dependent dipeptidase